MLSHEILKAKSPPISPRLNINSKSLLLCETHKEKIVSFCLTKKCNFMALCSKCIVIHLNTNHKDSFEEADLHNFETLKENYSTKLRKMKMEYEKLLKELMKHGEKKQIHKEIEDFKSNIFSFKEFLLKTLEESYSNFLQEFTYFLESQNSAITERLSLLRKNLQAKMEKITNEINNTLINEEFLSNMKEASSITLEIELEKNIKTCKKLISESLHLSNYQTSENNSELFAKFAKEINEILYIKYPLKTANTGLINNSSIHLEKNYSFLSKNSENSKFLKKSLNSNGNLSITEACDEKSPFKCLQLSHTPQIISRKNKNGMFLDNSIQEIDIEFQKKNMCRSLSPKGFSMKIEKKIDKKEENNVEFNEKQFMEFLTAFDKNWKNNKIKVVPMDLCRNIASMKNNNCMAENQKILKKFTNIYYETVNQQNTTTNSFYFFFILKENNGDHCGFLFSGTIRKNMELFFLNFNNQEKIVERHDVVINALKTLFSLFLHEKNKNLKFEIEEIKYVIFTKGESHDLKRLGICYALADIAKSKMRNGGVINDNDLMVFRRNLKSFYV